MIFPLDLLMYIYFPTIKETSESGIFWRICYAIFIWILVIFAVRYLLKRNFDQIEREIDRRLHAVGTEFDDIELDQLDRGSMTTENCGEDASHPLRQCQVYMRTAGNNWRQELANETEPGCSVCDHLCIYLDRWVVDPSSENNFYSCY